MNENDSLEQGMYSAFAKAKELAMELLSQGMALSTKAPDFKGQVQELADDFLSTSRNNREMLLGLVTSEVDRAVSRLGFVREDELAAVRRHVQRLEKEIAELKNSTIKPAKKAAVKKPAPAKASKPAPAKASKPAPAKASK